MRHRIVPRGALWHHARDVGFGPILERLQDLPKAVFVLHQ